MIDGLDNRVHSMEYINSQEFICDLLRTVDYSKDEIDENKRIMYAKYLTARCHIDNAENRCKRMFLELMEKINGLDFYILKSLKTLLMVKMPLKGFIVSTTMNIIAMFRRKRL